MACLTITLWIGLLALASFALADCLDRELPGWLLWGWWLAAAAGWGLGWWPASWAGALVGGGLVFLARFPGGDLKAALLVGVFVGPVRIAAWCGLAFLVTLLRWRRLSRSYATRAARRPDPWLLHLVACALAATLIELAFSLAMRHRGG